MHRTRCGDEHRVSSIEIDTGIGPRWYSGNVQFLRFLCSDAQGHSRYQQNQVECPHPYILLRKHRNAALDVPAIGEQSGPYCGARSTSALVSLPASFSMSANCCFTWLTSGESGDSKRYLRNCSTAP